MVPDRSGVGGGTYDEWAVFVWVSESPSSSPTLVSAHTSKSPTQPPLKPSNCDPPPPRKRLVALYSPHMYCARLRRGPVPPWGPLARPTATCGHEVALEHLWKVRLGVDCEAPGDLLTKSDSWGPELTYGAQSRRVRGSLKPLYLLPGSYR